MPDSYDSERDPEPRWTVSAANIVAGTVSLGTILVAVTLWVGSVASRTTDNSARLDRHADKFIRTDAQSAETNKLLTEILQRVTRMETRLEYYDRRR